MYVAYIESQWLSAVLQQLHLLCKVWQSHSCSVCHKIWRLTLGCFKRFTLLLHTRCKGCMREIQDSNVCHPVFLCIISSPYVFLQQTTTDCPCEPSYLFKAKLGAYRAVNTFHLGYTKTHLLMLCKVKLAVCSEIVKKKKKQTQYVHHVEFLNVKN